MKKAKISVEIGNGVVVHKEATSLHELVDAAAAIVHLQYNALHLPIKELSNDLDQAVLDAAAVWAGTTISIHKCSLHYEIRRLEED